MNGIFFCFLDIFLVELWIFLSIIRFTVPLDWRLRIPSFYDAWFLLKIPTHFHVRISLLTVCQFIINHFPHGLFFTQFGISLAFFQIRSSWIWLLRGVSTRRIRNIKALFGIDIFFAVFSQTFFGILKGALKGIFFWVIQITDSFFKLVQIWVFFLGVFGNI